MVKIAGPSKYITGFNSVMLHWDHCVELDILGGTSSIGNKITNIPELKQPAFSDIDEIQVDKNMLKRSRFQEFFKVMKSVRSTNSEGVAIVPVVCSTVDVAYLSVIRKLQIAKK
jgi:hypothetical protein